MIKVRITLTKETRQGIIMKIKQYEYLGNKKQVDIFRAILLYSEGVKISIIAEISLKTERCIYQWIVKFLSNGVNGIIYKEKYKKESKLSDNDKKKLKDIILKYSDENKMLKSSIVQKIIKEKFDIEYSIGYIPRLLNSLGLSHKKIETKSHKVDEKKQKEWENEIFLKLSKKSIINKGTVLFQDESSFLMWSQKCYSWGEIGKKLEMKVNMNSECRKVFGAIDIENGNFYYKISKKGNKDVFIEYLELLIKKFNGKKIYLVLDNGRVHRNKSVIEFELKNKDKIELCFLPPYSPKLNAIEILWREIKNNYMHGKFFKNTKDFIESLEKSLKNMSLMKEKILSIMSKWVEIYNKIEKKIVRWNEQKELFYNYSA